MFKKIGVGLTAWGWLPQEHMHCSFAPGTYTGGGTDEEVYQPLPGDTPPGEAFRLLPPSWRRPALVIVKAMHSLIYFSIEFCTGYLIYAGLKGQEDRRTAVAAGVVGAESLIFVGNRCRCPLTGLAEDLGATSGSVTDIYLPRWLASNLVPIHVPLLALALCLHARNSLRQSHALSKLRAFRDR